MLQVEYNNFLKEKEIFEKQKELFEYEKSQFNRKVKKKRNSKPIYNIISA